VIGGPPSGGRGAPGDGGRWGLTTASTALVLTLALALLPQGLAAVAGAAALGAAADPGADWREILRRSAEAARSTAYAGEVLWVTWSDDGQTHASVVEVRNTTDVGLVLQDAQWATTQLGDDGGLLHHDDGWLAPLPARPGQLDEDLADLDAKYQVVVVGVSRLLDRRCVKIEITRQDDGRLRELLWVDEASGLLLRRETHVGGRLVRLGSFLSLDLRPARRPVGGTSRVGSAVDPVRERPQQVAAVDRAQLAALTEAGWLVPDLLPGGYRPAGAFAVAADDGQPLQILYRDGLYTVSLFQQPGRIDRDALPAGAAAMPHLQGQAFEWPGAMPRRMVWEADGMVFSLVGDAPPDEFLAIAAALPQPARTGVLQRLRRGLGKIWRWVSPWE
jgi:hypothetical protein